MAKANKRAIRELPSAEQSLTISKREMLDNGSDRAFRVVLHDLLAFSARLQEIRNQLGRHIGLSGPQYTILISIAHMQGETGVGVNAVAEHLHTSGAFVTTEINKLVAAGFVQKRENQHDRRRVLVKVTPRGRALLTKLAEIQVPVNDKLFEPLTSADFARLGPMMKKLVDSADAALNLFQYLAPSRLRLKSRAK